MAPRGARTQTVPMATAPRQTAPQAEGAQAAPAPRSAAVTPGAARPLPAAAAWPSVLAAQQARVDASPRIAAQRQSLAAVMPVQRKTNTWLGHQNVKATPLREEIQAALQLPASALDAPWSQPRLSGIASHQAGHAFLPTSAGAKLSQIFSDRGSNPAAVSVHADIGNLEANLRAAGTATTAPSLQVEESKEAPKEASKEERKAPTLEPSPLDARWHKEMSTKAAKRTDRRTDEMPYQAGHLVAYQFMDDAANVFENVAPQGAQLNNVAFQNWEAGVLAESVKALRRSLGEARPEEEVPFFFDYEVRVTYPGDKYRVPVGALESQGLLPPDWQKLSAAPEPPAEVALTKRIPLGWEAQATPLEGSAANFTAKPASYGIVGANGKVSSNRHFVATGPEALAGGESAGRAVRSLKRQTRPSGLAVVAEALALVDKRPEDAEALLQKAAGPTSDELATAILAMTNAARFRTDYANRLGTEKPRLFNCSWTDSVTGKTLGPGQVLELAVQFAHPKAWADTPEVAKLKKEQTAVRRKYEDLKQQRKDTDEERLKPLKDAAKLAKEQREAAYKTEGGESEAYRRADIHFQQKVKERDALAGEIEPAQQKALAEIHAQMEKASAAFDDPINAAASQTTAELLRRYLDDVVDLQEALARLALSIERRRLRRGPAPEIKDPRAIDFLEPAPLPEHKAPAPLHFSAQETQP